MTEKPDLEELFSRSLDDGEMHADVLRRDGDENGDWEPDGELTPEQAADNLRQSVLTGLKLGVPEESILADLEVAFGVRPTPEQWAAFKAQAGVKQ